MAYRATHDVQDVIDWFLSKDSMSPKKLQKLLYYAYSWTLTLENEESDSLENKLFSERFEAWVHGPVIPSVYRKYKEYGYNDIPQISEVENVFSEDIEEILEQVWEEYGEFNGNELESITHQENPWKIARTNYSPLERCNVEISDESIFTYYVQELV